MAGSLTTRRGTADTCSPGPDRGWPRQRYRTAPRRAGTRRCTRSRSPRRIGWRTAAGAGRRRRRWGVRVGREQFLKPFLPLDRPDRRGIRRPFHLSLVIGGHSPAGGVGRAVWSQVHRGPPAVAVEHGDVIRHVHRDPAQHLDGIFLGEPQRLSGGRVEAEPVAEPEVIPRVVDELAAGLLRAGSARLLSCHRSESSATGSGRHPVLSSIRDANLLANSRRRTDAQGIRRADWTRPSSLSGYGTGRGPA